MIKYLFSSMLLCSGLMSKAQQQFGCGVPPLDSATAVSLAWYGDNEILYDFMNARIGTTDPSTRADANPLYVVPVRLVIYRNNSGDPSSAISESYARARIDEVNENFFNAHTAILFDVVDVDFVKNDFYRSEISSFGNTVDLFTSNRESGVVNIHFIHNTTGSFSTNSGYGINPSLPAIPFTRWSCFVTTHQPNGIQRSILDISTTTAHELGHVFGLLHTHHPGRYASLALNSDNATVDNGCYQEMVSRVAKNYNYNGCISTHNKNKCDVNGDFLCDTDADPNVGYEEFSNSSILRWVDGDCNWVINESGDYKKDNDGDNWTPPIRNIMSYTNRACRTEFSAGQIAIMWHYIQDVFMIDEVSISGPSLVCSSGQGTYTLSNVPSGASVSWTKSNNLTIVSGQGTLLLPLNLFLERQREMFG